MSDQQKPKPPQSPKPMPIPAGYPPQTGEPQSVRDAYDRMRKEGRR
ncbi:hypothetical protein [Marinitenerispora sediminis]|nr:hypothetical protein [Marinitenerispora sediminis]